MAQLTSKIAAVHYRQGFDVGALLAAVVDRLRSENIAVGGLLQEPGISGSANCAMLDLVDIRTGERAKITQNRGKESRGCKLDEQGLMSMSHCIDAAISDQVDLIVVSRFGRAEAAGHGLLGCFADVVCAEIPILTAVREPYVDRWHEFHGGLAVELPPSADAVVAWFGSLDEIREKGLRGPQVELVR
jgi:nucleoside-triphosphatase THEP1